MADTFPIVDFLIISLSWLLEQTMDVAYKGQQWLLIKPVVTLPNASDVPKVGGSANAGHCFLATDLAYQRRRTRPTLPQRASITPFDTRGSMSLNAKADNNHKSLSLQA